jgi:hypothetical protein
MKKTCWIRVQIFLQKPQRFSQIRVPKLVICPSTRKEVAARRGKEIHGHRRESILIKEKSLFNFWMPRPFLTCQTAPLKSCPPCYYHNFHVWVFCVPEVAEYFRLSFFVAGRSGHGFSFWHLPKWPVKTIATAKQCDKSPIVIKLNRKNVYYLHIWSQKNSPLFERFRLHKPPKIYLLPPALGRIGWLGSSFLRTVRSVRACPLNAWRPKHMKYWRGGL